MIEADLRDPSGPPSPATLGRRRGQRGHAALAARPRAGVPHRRRAAVAGRPVAAEAGGHGNIASIVAVLSDLGAGDGTGIWNFADVRETRARLAAAGFGEIEVNLVPDPARLDAGRQFEAYLATVVLGAHLRELPPGKTVPRSSAR